MHPAHISERKKNRKTNPCEREVGSLLASPATSGGYSQVDVAELVYAAGLGSSEATHEGSSPFIDTK